MTRWWAGALVSVLAAATVGCGVDTDSTPRPVSPGVLDTDQAGRARAAAPGVSAQVYLVAPRPDGQGVALQAVGRATPATAAGALAALSRGPTPGEVDDRLRSALPPTALVQAVGLRGSSLLVEVGASLDDVAGEELVQAVAQIVFTATALAGIKSVTITSDGVERQWPGGNGELRDRPLTRYDFPGLLASAQPAYPAVPSRVDEPASTPPPTDLSSQPKNTSATS